MCVEICVCVECRCVCVCGDMCVCGVSMCVWSVDVCVNGVLCGEKGKERRKKGEKELGQTNTDIHTNISTHTYT